MVEIFKTDVSKKTKAKNILSMLQKEFPHLKVNFDLGDCDKILRVEGKIISTEKIVSLMEEQKYLCELLQ
ncbi:MAG TPA: hypothetical protein VMH01_14650 [Puia sp.]|nr:hypothetical protein [Puia sp.]